LPWQSIPQLKYARERLQANRSDLTSPLPEVPAGNNGTMSGMSALRPRDSIKTGGLMHSIEGMDAQGIVQVGGIKSVVRVKLLNPF
jgi:hypothetical protein